MLSYRTIEEIYDKLHCVFRFNMVDYSPMSGGCHFTGNCEGYQHACGCCPAFESQDPNDFTHQNVMYRERVLKKSHQSLLEIPINLDFMRSLFIA